MAAHGCGDGMGDEKAGADHAEEDDGRHHDNGENGIENGFTSFPQALFGGIDRSCSIAARIRLPLFLFARCAHVVHSSHTITYVSPAAILCSLYRNPPEDARAIRVFLPCVIEILQISAKNKRQIMKKPGRCGSGGRNQPETGKKLAHWRRWRYNKQEMNSQQ